MSCHKNLLISHIIFQWKLQKWLPAPDAPLLLYSEPFCHQPPDIIWILLTDSWISRQRFCPCPFMKDQSMGGIGNGMSSCTSWLNAPVLDPWLHCGTFLLTLIPTVRPKNIDISGNPTDPIFEPPTPKISWQPSHDAGNYFHLISFCLDKMRRRFTIIAGKKIPKKFPTYRS